MTDARITTQFLARMPARTGLLADVAGAIAAAGVNIEAISAYERDGDGKFLMVTSDNAVAQGALARLDAAVTESSVVVLEMSDEPGALKDAARKIADADVNIQYVYGTARQGGAILVLQTSDNEKVAGLF